jgi:hypothetical protein
MPNMKSNAVILYLMVWKSSLLLLALSFVVCGCGIYSFSGASIEGKNINIHLLENRSQNVLPSLAATLTDKMRTRILSQTGLASVNADNADYDITGAITGYSITIAAAQSVQVATKNRLTVTVQINFKNKLNPKANFTQTFNRFSDFDAAQNIQSVEGRLIDDIGNQLADDIFNKAFVNW